MIYLGHVVIRRDTLWRLEAYQR